MVKLTQVMSDIFWCRGVFAKYEEDVFNGKNSYLERAFLKRITGFVKGYQKGRIIFVRYLAVSRGKK